MEQSPSWEANNTPATQKIPCILWEMEVHHHIHNSLPLVPDLSKINLGHILLSHCFKTNFNIGLPYMPRSSNWSLSFRFPDQTPVWSTSPFLHTCHMPCPFQPPCLFHPTNTGRTVQPTQLLIMQFSEVSFHFLPLRPKHIPRFLMSDSCIF